MCRVPDKDDPKYKDDEEAYEDDLEEMQEKTDALKPKDFPYTFYLMDAAQEKAFDDPIFATYRGPIYWNDWKGLHRGPQPAQGELPAREHGKPCLLFLDSTQGVSWRGKASDTKDPL